MHSAILPQHGSFVSRHCDGASDASDDFTVKCELRTVTIWMTHCILAAVGVLEHSTKVHAMPWMANETDSNLHTHS